MDTHAASDSFAVITAATTAVVAQAEFPAAVAGLARAVYWAGRRAGEPAGVLIVVEGVGSYGAPVARAFTENWLPGQETSACAETVRVSVNVAEHGTLGAGRSISVAACENACLSWPKRAGAN